MGERKTKNKGNSAKRKEPQRTPEQEKRMKKWVLVAECIIAIVFLLTLLFGKELPFDGVFWDGNRTGEGTFLPNGDTQLVLTYLDVGQADCTILQYEEHAMMIDGGGRSTAEEVLEAVRELGIEKFDYVVATHAHEDHIGGLPDVFETFPVETAILREEESSSKIYKEFREAVKESGAVIMMPEVGDVFAFGDATVQVLAPEEPISDLNDGSIALMVTFGEKKFLFTGDAEEPSEERMLKLGVPLEVDVFQAGHHGSQTSNTAAFLKVVDPVYVVISCGEGNSYGHPHSEVIARFQDIDTQIYRTDTMGTITVRTDGYNFSITTQGK